MPLTKSEKTLLESDKSTHPSCTYSVSTSTSTSWSKGSSKTTEAVKVFRRCRDEKDNKYVIDRTGSTVNEGGQKGGQNTEVRTYITRGGRAKRRAAAPYRPHLHY